MIQKLDLETNQTLLGVLLDKHREKHSCVEMPARKEMSFAYRKDGKYVGGITGSIFYNRLNISLLAVDKDYRGSGVGRGLIDAALAYAQENGCTCITVSTLDYQGPAFYEHFGFTSYAHLEDVPAQGLTTYFYIKYL